ncbi:hypothetical protein [Intestinimonas butyriciproducens]|uniref:Lipoprotein n=1 Tax=Intestinimonas butyriciproducens TaxID=1297617 RepID=A0A2U1C1H8_9FIRM|nr:hypothetical protein [Intestinimonas butyriciproducens]MCR1906654.1 hypothetical protein [Intestinimonas butyriciproducens]PVY54760.1 hypothetical protein C7373_105182 [Intestinimonas butyriciproducens]QBB66887.1 hypothetical protein SRB521_02629 [Intestinimonas butyriciproducens]
MGKRTWMALALSLALLAGCGYRTMPAQGEEPAPGGASSAVETAPGGETAMPAQTPEEGVRAVCRVVDGGAEGALILAGEEAGEVYTLDVSALGLEEPLADGMMVEILYDGMILETWPAQFANVLAVRPAEGAAAADRCGLCLQVLADLWEVDAGLNEDITQLGVDLSGFTGLTEGEKAAVAYAFGMEHDILPVMGTWEELAEQGYIDRENLYWEDGCLFSITGETGKFDAQKWRSGLGAYFFLDCTASMEQDGTWTYTVGGEAIA